MKTLFALSRNVCYYTGCEKQLTDPSWRSVRARIAHIRGESEGSARYDPDMTDKERAAFENLMLLCPNCHNLVDDLDPVGHPVEALQEMKRRAESHGGFAWADEKHFSRWARLTLKLHVGVRAPNQVSGQASSVGGPGVGTASGRGRRTTAKVSAPEATTPDSAPANITAARASTDAAATVIRPTGAVSQSVTGVGQVDVAPDDAGGEGRLEAHGEVKSVTGEVTLKADGETWPEGLVIQEVDPPADTRSESLERDPDAVKTDGSELIEGGRAVLPAGSGLVAGGVAGVAGRALGVGAASAIEGTGSGPVPTDDIIERLTGRDGRSATPD